MPVFNRKNREEEINMTPLIDVIFILLIFFMITAQFRKPSLPVDLPEASSELTENDIDLILTASADKKLYLNGDFVNKRELKNTLTGEKEKNPSISVTLACDQTLSFGYVVQLLDILSNAGIENIRIDHEPINP